MSNVIFFPTFYTPHFTEMLRLEEIQRQLSYARAELHREWQLKKYQPGEIFLSKERFHNGFRDRWLVFPGFQQNKVEKVSEP
jgi:hypothetical protein